MPRGRPTSPTQALRSSASPCTVPYVLQRRRAMRRAPECRAPGTFCNLAGEACPRSPETPHTTEPGNGVLVHAWWLRGPRPKVCLAGRPTPAEAARRVCSGPSDGQESSEPGELEEARGSAPRTRASGTIFDRGPPLASKTRLRKVGPLGPGRGRGCSTLMNSVHNCWRGTGRSGLCRRTLRNDVTFARSGSPAAAAGHAAPGACRSTRGTGGYPPACSRCKRTRRLCATQSAGGVPQGPSPRGRQASAALAACTPDESRCGTHWIPPEAAGNACCGC